EIDLKEKTPPAKPQAFLATKEKSAAPQVTRLHPGAGPRGRPLRLAIEGKNLDGIHVVTANAPGFSGTILPDGRTPTSLRAEISSPASTPAGIYPLTLQGPGGNSPALPFTVDLFSATSEQEPNDSPGRGQRIVLPTTLIGSIAKAGDVDFFQF